MEDQMSEKTYGLRITTIDIAIQQLEEDVEYLCSMVETPDPDFIVRDAVAYSLAMVALLRHLEFAEDLAENEISDDGIYIKVNDQELVMMREYTEGTEVALTHLEETCGISLRKN
jgi:hypothetical protein